MSDPTDKDFVTPAKIDAFSMHEVLHVASLITDLFDREICEHPAVMANAQMRARAIELVDRLAGFYQFVSAESLPKLPPKEPSHD